MKEIVLDTETTGRDPASGHRIVEIGCVEVLNYLPTGRHFHEYVNPERDMPDDAFRVHGLSVEFLSDKPKFIDIAEKFLDFVGDEPLVIHNAGFDMKFLNAELSAVGFKTLPMSRSRDTLQLARNKYPGQPASLDALCRRFGVNNSGRELHGALLDAQLLAEVYFHMMGGAQPELFDAAIQAGGADVPEIVEAAVRAHRTFAVPEDELVAHEKFIDSMGNKAIWKTKVA